MNKEYQQIKNALQSYKVDQNNIKHSLNSIRDLISIQARQLELGIEEVSEGFASALSKLQVENIQL